MPCNCVNISREDWITSGGHQAANRPFYNDPKGSVKDFEETIVYRDRRCAALTHWMISALG